MTPEDVHYLIRNENFFSELKKNIYKGLKLYSVLEVK